MLVPFENSSISKYPALLIITRYRRSIQDGKTGEPISTLSALDKHLLASDYVLVKVDAPVTVAVPRIVALLATAKVVAAT